MPTDWHGSAAWTGDRTIAVFWRKPDGTWTTRAVEVKGSGPGASFRFADTGEPVTASEIRDMAASKRKAERMAVCAYHVRKGGR
jgi:hypothetical protein